MNVIDRLRFAFSNSFNDYVKAFLHGDDSTNSESQINREVALCYSAIFACTRVLSETLASMPAFVYRREDEKSKVLGNDIGLYDILHYEPNYEMAPFNFKESLMMNLCLGGNAYAQKVFSKAKVPELLALYPLDYENVICERDNETKKLTYKVKDGASQKTLTRDYIFHIPGVSMNGITGLIPINYATKAINLGLTYESFGVNFYKNGANTNLVVFHPKALSDIAFNRFKSQFDKRTGVDHVNKPLYIEEGTNIKELTIKPVDAQLLESKYFQIEEICRFYRVPLHLVQHLLRATNNNIEHQGLEFVIYTMLPWAKRIEENINLQLLTRDQRKAGYYTEFKFDSLLRGDIKSRYEAYAQGRLNSWLSANDIRRLENMNPIDGGDTYIQPLNYIDITKADDYFSKQSDAKKALAEEIFKMIDKEKQLRGMR